MTLFFYRKQAMVTLIAILLAACTRSNSSEQRMTNSVMHDARPWCIARFYLSLPRDAEIYNQQFKYMGFTIKATKNVSQEQYLDRVTNREHSLATSMRMDMSHVPLMTKNPWLHQNIRLGDHAHLFIFRDGDSATVDIPYDVEGYAWSGDSLFTAKTDFGVRYDDRNLQVADQLLRNIHPRGEWDVPMESESCFDGGAIGGKLLPSFDAGLSARLVPGRPSNLIVDLRESVDVDQQVSLLKGLSGFEAQLSPYAGHYKVLRKGIREVTGMKGEEILVEIHGDGVQMYQFYLLAPGVVGDVSKPHTSIQLQFGAEPDAETPSSVATSPVSEVQAIEAWDTVLNSFHFRDTGNQRGTQ